MLIKVFPEQWQIKLWDQGTYHYVTTIHIKQTPSCRQAFQRNDYGLPWSEDCGVTYNHVSFFTCKQVFTGVKK